MGTTNHHLNIAQDLLNKAESGAAKKIINK
jgi:hypothetical protein